MPLLGLHSQQDAAPLGRDARRGRRRPALAASRVEWTVDFPKISKRVLWMARDLDDSNAAKAIAGDGVELIRGEAQMTGPAPSPSAGAR